MSVSVYAGPYFRMTIGKKEISERHLMSPCFCKGTNFNLQSKFCSLCGAQLKVVNVTALVNDIHYGDIQQAMRSNNLGMDDIAELNLYVPGIIMIPNLEGKTIGQYWGEYGSMSDILLSEKDVKIDEDKAKLATAYARHYEVLKGLRGPERVTIEWGVVVTEE